MTARRLRLGLALSALLLLSACATRPPVPAADARAVDRETRLNRWAEHRQALDAWAQFQLEGRVAASGQALSARLRWVQRALPVFRPPGITDSAPLMSPPRPPLADRRPSSS